MEMTTDSRVRAEQWVRDNLDKRKDAITFISPREYMPRSELEGYRVVYRVSNMTSEGSIAAKPEYIALSQKWYEDPLYFDQHFRERLLSGQLGYRKVAEFGPQYSAPGVGPFAIATIMTRAQTGLSPRIVFMQRID